MSVLGSALYGGILFTFLSVPNILIFGGMWGGIFILGARQPTDPSVAQAFIMWFAYLTALAMALGGVLGFLLALLYNVTAAVMGGLRVRLVDCD